MTLPRFSGEASLYRTNAFYRNHASVPQGPPPSGLVEPAYRPLPATQSDCSECNDSCDQARDYCNALVIPLDVACAFAFWIGGAPCVAAGVAHFYCNAVYVGCKAYCLSGRCCPKVCGFPDPLHPGEGCCDSGEHCVDENDPNSRSGCCSRDRAVCGRKCCNSGEVCVGDFCCPPGATTVCNGECCTGTCTPGGRCCPSPMNVCGNDCCPPFNRCVNGQCLPPAPPPPPPPTSCPPGANPCGFPDASGVVRTCCPPGLQCCGYSAQFGPDCKTSCLR
jgi:hypothetical protein